MSYPYIARGSKIGFHQQMGGPALDFARVARDRDAPLALGKSVDDNGNCLRLKRESPATIVISRSAHSELEACPGMDEHPTNQRLIDMAVTMADFLERKMNAEEREAIDYIEWWNEPRPHTVDGYRSLAHLMLYTMEESERRRFPPAALFSLNAGTCEWDEMHAVLETGVMSRMIDGGHIWTVHEGLLPYRDYNRDTPILAGVGEAIRNPYTGVTSPAFHDAGILCLRYRFWIHKARELGITLAPFFVSEWYESVHRPLSDLSVEDVITRCREYDAELSKDKLCLGVTPFTLGNGWESENQSAFYPAIIDYNISVRERNNAMADPLDQLDPRTIVVTVPTAARPLPAPVIIQYVEDTPSLPTLPLDALGIDISKWQSQGKPPINWPMVKDVARVQYVFIKASEGAISVDEFLVSHRNGAKSVGLPYGFYHYVRGDSGVTQANHFLNTLGDDTGTLPLVLDVEEGAPTIIELRRCVDRLHQRLPDKPIMIYTRAGLWAEIGGASPIAPSFNDCQLWVSHPNAITPILPVGWNTYDFWQINWQTRIPGIAGDVDIDKHKGSILRPWYVRDMTQVFGSTLPVRYQVRPKVSGAPVTLYKSPHGAIDRVMNITWISDVTEITLDGWLRVDITPPLWGRESDFKV